MKQWQRLFALFAVLFLTYATGAAQPNVEGRVSDESGNPLPGVNVIIEGTTTGTVTGMDGLFTIQAFEGQNLVIRFIGMTPQVIEIMDTDAFLNIVLEQELQALEELVVVGYGTQKKESVVGAIGTATGEDLKVQGNVSNMRDALVGSIAGIAVLPSSGLAGGQDVDDGRLSRQTEILIRGKTTWNDASPLILVDGVERSMDDINVNEVASVSVLKDASATAVFGVKGGNGVILITTKRGQEGKAVFNVEAEMSIESPSMIVEGAGTVEGLRARNYASERTRRFQGANSYLAYTSDEVMEYYRNGTYPYAFPDNDWIDILFKDFTQSYRFNSYVSGGTQKVKYFASVGYNHFEDLLDVKDVGQGYVPDFDYDRLNIRSNFDFQISPTTVLKANYSGIFSTQSNPPSTSWNGIFDGLVDQPGNSQVVVYEDGVYGAENTMISVDNPVYRLYFSGKEQTNRTTINMDYILEQDLSFITEGLSLSGKLAYDNLFVNNGVEINDNRTRTKTIDPEFYLQGGYYDYDQQVYMLNDEPVEDMAAAGWAVYFDGGGGETDAGFGWLKEPLDYDPESLRLGSSVRTLYYETRLNYARDFGNHGVTGLAMFSRQERERGSGWPNKREDWVGRLTYNYADRYLLEVNGAYNGSEKFGPEYRFDFFPSVAVGWVISNENFMQTTEEWLNNLKLRYSNGLVGNDRVNIGTMWPYLTIYDIKGETTTLNYSRLGYPVSEYEYIAYLEGIPGNPDLRWEKANKQNLGLEVGLFRNKIMFTADLFKEYRYDMLLAASERGVPEISGKPPTAANVGEAKSRGIDLEFTYRNTMMNNAINYWVKTNWSVARSEVVYKETPDLVPEYQAPEGFPLEQSRTPISSGFIESWDDLYIYSGSNVIDETSDLMPGDLAMVDFDADGAFESNDDVVPYGYPVYPQNNYGIAIGADYKGIEFMVQFVGAYNVTRRIDVDMFSRNNAYVPAYVLDDTWTPAYNNEYPTYPAFALDDKYTPMGQYRYYDGSFFRLQTLQLSYNLPQRWTRSMSVENLQVFVNGRNLLLLTRMPDDGVGANHDTKNYPVKKQYNFGINIRF
jgi:TonB-linked SusC/RagA family outer membrane protein